MKNINSKSKITKNALTKKKWILNFFVGSPKAINPHSYGNINSPISEIKDLLPKDKGIINTAKNATILKIDVVHNPKDEKSTEKSSILKLKKLH